MGNANTVRANASQLYKGKAIAPKAISITIKESRPDYAAMTIRELKKLCKGTGIKGWEKLRKAALVEALCAV
jgi:hypothetical protein